MSTNKKYSTILLELIEPYHSAFPTFDEIQKLLDIVILSWNVSKLKSITPDHSSKMEEEIKKEFKKDKESFQVFKKLCNEIEAKYRNDNLFIDKVVLDTDNENNPFVTVQMIDEASFLEDFLTTQLPKNQLYNFQPSYINRNAFILKPKQPFFDWLKQKDPTNSFAIEIYDPQIYLIEEKTDNSAIELWLRNNYKKIFEKELEGWYEDSKYWPMKRTYKLFCEWFEVSYHSMIYDLEKYPVDKDIL